MDKRVLFIAGALILASYRMWHGRRQGIGKVASLGLTVDGRALVEFVVGSAISFCSLLAVFTLELQFGLLTIVSYGSTASLGNISTPLVVALVEEFVFRSALLGALLTIMAPLGAILLSALAFAATHVSNQNITGLALICTFIGGLVYGFAFIATKRLWLPIGLHFAWNYTEGRVLGFAISGYTVSESFVRQHDSGPALWTGGPYGPEGGLLGIATKLLTFALVFAVSRCLRPSTSTNAATFKERACYSRKIPAK